jgi:hypothetical protein
MKAPASFAVIAGVLLAAVLASWLVLKLIPIWFDLLEPYFIID